MQGTCVISKPPLGAALNLSMIAYATEMACTPWQLRVTLVRVGCCAAMISFTVESDPFKSQEWKVKQTKKSEKRNRLAD